MEIQGMGVFTGKKKISFIVNMQFYLQDVSENIY